MLGINHAAIDMADFRHMLNRFAERLFDRVPRKYILAHGLIRFDLTI